MPGIANAAGKREVEARWVVNQGCRASQIREFAPAVLHVADAAGETEGIGLLLISERDIPDIVIYGRGEKKTVENWRVVANEITAQRINIMGDLAPSQVGNNGGFCQIQSDSESVIVVNRS